MLYLPYQSNIGLNMRNLQALLNEKHMKNQTFIPIPEEIITKTLAELTFSSQGLSQDLIPAITQQYDSGEILMMAWMNADAVRETLRSGVVCYWSRSRNALWRKGEISGQVQTLKNFRYDCDRDSLLLLVDQKGVACHTGRRNCFFYETTSSGIKNIHEVEIDPEDLYPK